MPSQSLSIPARVSSPRAPRSAHQSTATDTTRAVEYVRMSTDHQQYSIANQREAIARYAEQRGLSVIRTYTDEGRSGLNLEGRKGLGALLDDVTSGRADYTTVLVYDISRWGRFQDCDESACYEFLCRRAGIAVEYCMEPFSNDGSAMASVVKALKRVMAGEYSRELSVKVYAGKCRLIREGYRQGGIAGYGLRRMVVDAKGHPGAVLTDGQHKYLQTDRIVLVPGPKKEVQTVRWIFKQVAHKGAKPTWIARSLNERGVPSRRKVEWTDQNVRGILQNEKYIGNLVFNKVSVKLKGPTVRNEPDRWVRTDGAFAGIVDPELFWEAHRVMATWPQRITNATAIAMLKDVYERHGTLSAVLINQTAGMPGSVFYEHRFGGLIQAYALVGFTPGRDYGFIQGYSKRRRVLDDLRRQVTEGLEARGAAVEPESKVVRVIDGQLRLAVLLGLPRVLRGQSTWRSQIHVKPQVDWALIARLCAKTDDIEDYCLVESPGAVIELGLRHRKLRVHQEGCRLDQALDFLVKRDDLAGSSSS